jgi:hypothetical protein
MGASAFQHNMTDSSRSSTSSEEATQLNDPSARHQIAPKVIYSPLKFTDVFNTADLVSPVGQQAAEMSLHAHH